ncbi:unnamed protein product [Periconia digitata]|uniref:FAD-binding FR-type domain-containing protein n=1 Tax=Periconia digitata TaxID=1303443 RepID=A0A9W4XKY4_9PLEO|nr:unnamed protein product [Periconia digitata]
MTIMGGLSLAFLAFTGTASAMIGYGIEMYKPNCAFACRNSMSSVMLSCSDMDMAGGHHGHGGAMPTSPECYAEDEPWLTSLAYCINETCDDTVAPWVLEKYWFDQCTGDKTGVQPKWTYQQSLEQLQNKSAPTKKIGDLGEHDILDSTMLYDDFLWESFRGTLWAFENAETHHSRMIITLITLTFATPILLSLVVRLPFMTGVMDKLKPRLIYPSLIGTYHTRPLPFNLGNSPTVGQALWIAGFAVVNVILTAVGYSLYTPNLYFETKEYQILCYVAARTGGLSFALAPLVVLFAGRNNILLWLTNWSHSTFMLLHRWVARFFTLHIILHSLLELVLYQKQGTLTENQSSPYWIWGIIGTIACSIMVVTATLYFRRLSYEIFLIIHIILAVFTIAGSWYHIEIRFERKWGYEYYMYATCAVWFFDRVLRVLRILKNGMRKAHVTQVADDIMRIDIPGLKWEAQPGRHTYAYFPTVNPLRPWENHPFSVIPTALLQSRGHSLGVVSSSQGSQHSSTAPDDIEKSGTSTVTSAPVVTSAAGISLFVRRSAGMTRALKAHASLTTLLDGPYPNNKPASVLKTDRLVLLAGGIGITGILPFLAHHHNVKLHWSVKQNTQGLVDTLGEVLNNVREKEISVGRFDLEGILAKEAQTGWGRIGVVVCGPGGMCDEVRSIVARKGREGKVVWELDVEAFSW